MPYNDTRPSAALARFAGYGWLAPFGQIVLPAARFATTPASSYRIAEGRYARAHTALDPCGKDGLPISRSNPRLTLLG